MHDRRCDLPVRTWARRAGFTKVELAVTVAVCAILLFLIQNMILASRERSRQQHCTSNLRQIHTALECYHDIYRVLPPAAVWRSSSHDDADALHQSHDVAATTYQNWLQLLLPYVDQQDLAATGNDRLPIGAPENEKIRTAELPFAKCPSDEFHSVDNHFEATSIQFGDLEFARGSYAFNGGTHRFASRPGTSADPVPNGFHYIHGPGSNEMAYWGSGVAGFNKSFSYEDFTNGRATMVAVDEVRAGIHPRDSRGVWALGQIGGSVTWAHGMNGDAGHPNDLWKRADDIAGCHRLHELFGEQGLVDLGMPCCSYCSYNDQAAARSQHPGGVHVLMLDGSVHFVSNQIDAGLWHVMHSRDTPAETFGGHFTEQLEGDHFGAGEEDIPGRSFGQSAANDAEFTNSLGMQFKLLPSGRFIMGLPDEELNAVFELEGAAKPHWVEITAPYHLAVHEVSRAVYATVMKEEFSDDGAEQVPGELSDIDEEFLPATNMTWYEAEEFCRRLSNLPEEKSAERSYRLPTEAEWEYACRAGSTDPYVYIPKRQPDDQSGKNAMISPALPIGEVGHYPPNDFGICDMRGNAWEWCNDWSDYDYYEKSPERDPQGPAEGFLKVVRGSDWLYVGQRCMLGFRATEPWCRSPFVGFRVICEARKAE